MPGGTKEEPWNIHLVERKQGDNPGNVVEYPGVASTSAVLRFIGFAVLLFCYFSFLIWSHGGRNRGTEEQRNRGTEEQKNRGTEEQRNRGTEEQKNRRTEEQKNRGTEEVGLAELGHEPTQTTPNHPHPYGELQLFS